MPNMFCFCFLILKPFVKGKQLINLEVQLYKSYSIKNIVNLSNLISFIIQSAFFLAYTWNPSSIRVFTTEPFHAWSTVPFIAYDKIIINK